MNKTPKKFPSIFLAVLLSIFTIGQTQTASAVALSLGDDSSANVALGFTFNFQGVDYTDINVNSNGNITFGSGDGDFSESVSELLSDQPRIAVLWDDLNPATGGTVDATGDSNSMLVSWSGVPEFYSTGSNTFSAELFSDGTIQMVYGNVSASDGIVGISPGNGLLGDPGQTNFSAGSGFYANTGVIYEDFSDFDLSGQTLTFQSEVPEPATASMLLLGGVGALYRRRKSA